MSTDSPAKPPVRPAVKPSRLPLGGIGTSVPGTDDVDPIRQYGLSRGFLPTEPASASSHVAPPILTHSPPPPEPLPSPAPPSIVRPAPTRPWQAMLPDYLVEELRQAAAREGTAQKVIVLKALRQAGFQIDDIDLQDLRRR